MDQSQSRLPIKDLVAQGPPRLGLSQGVVEDGSCLVGLRRFGVEEPDGVFDQGEDPLCVAGVEGLNVDIGFGSSALLRSADVAAAGAASGAFALDWFRASVGRAGSGGHGLNFLSVSSRTHRFLVAE